MSAFMTSNGNVCLAGLTPEKVEALVRAIEGASLPEKQMLQHELKWLKNPAPLGDMAKRTASLNKKRKNKDEESR